MSEHYGATRREWVTFDLILGLSSDLLPVVSNPKAEISPKSTIEARGKVPSRYNGRRKIAGIKGWSEYRANDHDLQLWSREPDYGICVQTRDIRAIDVDITDQGTVDKILWSIAYGFNDILPPIRRRANSPKCLLGFKLSGELSKRTIKTSHGIIEFLANGQQFIAAGTHPSGARYEWSGLDDFPELTLAEFETLWGVLQNEFGLGASTHAGLRKQGEDRTVRDDTLSKLTILSWGPQGQANIECPFAKDHTTESGESSTSYFPAGTHGYEQGHFVCLHAHCHERPDEDFLDAFGVRAAELYDPVEDDAKLPVPRPPFKRTEAGEIYATLDNLYQALKRDDVCDARIAYDRFRDEVVITSAKISALKWRSFTDNDYTILQRHLERVIGFKPITFDLLRRTVNLIAHENSFDSAILWLESLVWDGVARVDQFMALYLKAEGNAYARAVSRYLWTALAGRVLVPGIKADMVPIWESGQGRIKSSAVEALAPDPEFFLEVDLNEKESDLTRKMRGKLVGEINELRGLQTKDAQSINAFITRKYEEWVPKYLEKSQRTPRRIIFIGTTNKKEILNDGTGKRRWLPTRVEYADIAAILRDRDQLWAEGKELFLKLGICYEEAEKLAPKIHGDYTIRHPWEDIILEWLETAHEMGGQRPSEKGYIKMSEVMQQALHLDTRNMKGNDSKEIAEILRGAGYNNTKKWTGKKMASVWEPPESLT